ncbi:MAG: chemotaxis protein CheW [Nannocystaceae bacterium]
MAAEGDDLWQALARTGESVATDEDYEHGYKQREVRRDLRHYVAFKVGAETYGLPIAEIEEITKIFPTTFVPRTADFLLGIGNVRGRIIPVVELSRRLGLGSPGYGRSARVLIVTLDDEPYGLLVHEVLEVVRIPPEAMEERPGGISGRRADYIRGLGRHRGEIIILLNLAEVLDARDFVKMVDDRGAP